MLRARPMLPLLALLATLHCGSEDPRIPRQMYEEAVRLNQGNQGLAAKAMMERLVEQFPNSPAAKQARKDLFLIESMLKQGQADQQRLVRTSMQRIADALTRYKGKRGEYPLGLRDLVPDYLEQVPETPWSHPFLFRPYVPVPMEDVRDRRGNLSQRFNTRLDGYYLVCLGTDLSPGGEGLAADTLIVNGEFSAEKLPPPIALPQPVR